MAESDDDGPKFSFKPHTVWTFSAGAVGALIWGAIQIVSEQRAWQTKVDLDHTSEVEKQALRDDALKQRLTAIESLLQTMTARLDARDDSARGGRDGARR